MLKFITVATTYKHIDPWYKAMSRIGLLTSRLSSRAPKQLGHHNGATSERV